MNAPTALKRDPKRCRAFLSVRFHAGNGAEEARIRDVSTAGALLETDNLPPAGNTIEITCGETVLRGRVAWADRGWFSTEFDSRLALGRLVDSEGVKMTVSAPGGSRASDPWFDHRV